MTTTTTPEHTYNWTCLLVSSHNVPRDDDAPECQACRVVITGKIVAEIRMADRWNRLRDHITGERAAQDQLAADHGELGHRDQEERAYGRVEALDGLLATMDRMDRMEAGQ